MLYTPLKNNTRGKMYIFGSEVPLIYILSASAAVYAAILIVMLLQMRDLYQKYFKIQYIDLKLSKIKNQVSTKNNRNLRLKSVISSIKE